MARPVSIFRRWWQDEPSRAPDAFDDAFRYMFIDPNSAYGIIRFFRESTFGLWDLNGSQASPWRSLGLNHFTFANPAKPDLTPTRSTVAATAWGEEEEFGWDSNDWASVVVFVDPPPSDSGAHGSTCVLDWKGPHSWCAHEMGHTLGLDHSAGANGKDYGDPFCLMSIRTLGGKKGMFSVPPNERFAPANRGGFFDEVGPRPAGATLYHYLGGFASSPAVVRLPGGPPAAMQRVSLRALSEGDLQTPMLAVMQIGGREWTAEYRVRSNWDRGLSLAPAVVIHSIEPSTEKGNPIRPRYRGHIPVPVVNGVTDWQDPSVEGLRIALERTSPQAGNSIGITFGRTVDRSISLQASLETVSKAVVESGRKVFPIYGGLCGDRECDYTIVEQQQRIHAVARLRGGYGDPIYTWTVNGVPITQDGSSSITVPVPRGLGRIAPAIRWVVLECSTNKQSAELLLDNHPSDGEYGVSITVSVRESWDATGAETRRQAKDEQTISGRVLSSPQRDEAERDCKSKFDDIEHKARKHRIKPGDDVQRWVREHFAEDEVMQDRVLTLIGIHLAEPTDALEAALGGLHIPPGLLGGH